MGSFWSLLMPSNAPQDNGFKVLIIGAGIVGLTVAQGRRENGIPFEIFERDVKGSRAQGWALTLHWCLNAFERTLGSKIAASIPTAVVDSSLKEDAGNFLFLNCATCEPRYRIPPSKRRLRLHRQKLRDVISSGLDIQEGKRLKAIEELPQGGVKAHFTDGTSSTGSMIVGADGNNSAVRKYLLPKSFKLNHLPVNLVGVVRHFTPEQAAPIRALDPLLFQGLHPDTGNYLWYSIQECIDEPDGRKSFDALVIISWFIKDEVKDAIPATHAERIALMKQRAEGYAEPLRSIVIDIPDDLPFTTPLRLADFPSVPWDNRNGQVTLAGDSGHAMTMYRGEGANHGILDAALLVDQLKKIHEGSVSLKTAIDAYEIEMRPRTHAAVLKSRQAALDAHDWDALTEDSPTIGARSPPATA
ncbi:FAD/NAD(P)-binding domain-containing protein [Mollisia scopiformis]|uniref:FAD/NAD(P)-binding domain-containing protein n=1 Tax=Mollisia scopiformis TaxID=149040 RepID=A0A194X0H9_MOLSC|nr:FAD/NAD(P)-binding domain-containing protein [Mollisia scopiformis]KUJ13695.1 FAD/NAD(P)-binding domain-containing protein [Mollisia scopiformis]